ncbi:EF1G factor, partial [Copsychus sechellarum]|nr:EF1G factor [Copsychus sechellarum]
VSPQTLYTYPENWRAFKALIAAQYSGARLRVLSAPPQFHFGHTNRSPQFLQKFPLGKVPAFEGDDGFCVFESNAIAYYVSTEELRGSTPEAAAAVLQWVNFADSDVVPPASTWVFPTLGILHYNKQATEVAKEEVRRVLGVLDGHLRTRTFLVGERVSLADISLVCTLLWLYKQVMGTWGRYSTPGAGTAHLGTPGAGTAHLGTGTAHLGQVQHTWGVTEGEPGRHQPGVRPALALQTGNGHLGQVQHTWGRYSTPGHRYSTPGYTWDRYSTPGHRYSTSGTGTAHLGQVQHTWAQVQHTWVHLGQVQHTWGRYSTPGGSQRVSLADISLVCALLWLYKQRLDKLRKNAFASVVLFGSDHDSSISGVWVMRGQELAFTLCPDWQVDYESYTWRKLDPESAECRTLVQEYFLWEGEFRHVGKPFNQGKIFK